jgi:RNA-directed DNA polymerase
VLLQVGFSENRFGFRPGRSAHDAVRKAEQDIQEGYRWAVDIDWAKCFDRVHPEMLMARVARKVQDKRVLQRIRAYRNAGIMADGVVIRNEEGTPQGGPLSPLLANLRLDDFDQEWEKRGPRVVR